MIGVSCSNRNDIPVNELTPTNTTIQKAISNISSDPHVKPRVIATTDGEVDDRSSMVRFLMYASDYDVMGIVQVNSRYQEDGHSDAGWIQDQIDAY
jgi:hypothetical protein